MPSGNSGFGKFQLDGKRSFGPAIGSPGYAGDGHLYCRSRDACNDHGDPRQWRDFYRKSFPDLQLNDLQLTALPLMTCN